MEEEIIQEEVPQKKKRENKTKESKIKKSMERYYLKKEEILAANCLANIQRLGRIPFLSSITKHDITWEQIARELQTFIMDHPNPDSRVVERSELKEYRKMIHRKRMQDEFTSLQHHYINVPKCEVCETSFSLECPRKMNMDKYGYFTKVTCLECLEFGTRGVACEEQVEEKLQAEE